MRTIVTAICLVILCGANVTVRAEEPPAPLWGRNLRGGSAAERLSALAATSDGGFLAVGIISGKTWELDGVKVTSSAPKDKRCAVLCRFDAKGRLLWARSPSVSSADSEFTSAAEGKDGRIYAVGHIVGSGSFTFAPDVKVKGASSSVVGNPLLVAFDASGRALWARSTIAGTEACEFSSVAIDDAGNVFVAGYLGRQVVFSFGPGVEAKGTSYNVNALVVKYDSDGNALWARGTDAGYYDNCFSDICVDDAGSAYAVGYCCGESLTIGGVKATGYQNSNALVVKYDSRGTVAWVRMPGSTAGRGSKSPGTFFYGIAPSGTGAGEYLLTGCASDREGVCRFEPDVDVVCLRNDTTNSFVAGLDGEGHFIGAVSCDETPGNVSLTSIAVLRDGTIAIGGTAAGTGEVAFGDIRASVNRSDSVPETGESRNRSCITVFGFEAGGTPIWSLTSGGTSKDSAIHDICSLTGGELLVLGYSYGSGMVFGSYTSSSPAPGSYGDGFLAAFAGRR